MKAGQRIGPVSAEYIVCLVRAEELRPSEKVFQGCSWTSPYHRGRYPNISTLSRSPPNMAKRPKRTTPTATPNGAPARMSRQDLRDRLLTDFATLKVPLTAEQLDAILARAERDGLTHPGPARTFG
jgi:hypothetical protein